MALLDFLKNRKDAEKSKKNVVKKTPSASVAKKVEKVESTPVTKSSTSSKKGFSYSVIKEPHISEKANTLSESSKYTFKVYPNVNKQEIKKSVEGIYNVNVTAVNMIKIPHKKRRIGRTEGFRKAFIKAVVTLKPGQKIEIF